jgi:hypothetical protein
MHEARRVSCRQRVAGLAVGVAGSSGRAPAITSPKPREPVAMTAGWTPGRVRADYAVHITALRTACATAP